MNDYVKKILITLIGGACIFIGLFFILLPGPAVIFLPLGFALLSLEYAWAKVWLRKVQKWFRVSAVKADQSILWLKRRFSK
ncbi:MAG: PGPGW domain-containing protein [Colwellia sp.]|nr:PGPGW domain-containing protein [Colwellia sp.]